MSQAPSDVHFPPTHWSLVLAAGNPSMPCASEALTDLCRAYWFPLYAYIRRRGYSQHEAQDLTQDLFGRLLERGTIGAADPARGRFRAFLRAVCSDFLANHRDRDHALKRGGGASVISIDLAHAEERYAYEPAHELTAERIFDRTWTLTLLTRVLDSLRGEYEADGRGSIFEALKVVLTDGSHAAPYATIAHRLGISEGGVRVAVHRLRRRYGDLLREEIGATVDHPSEVDDEIRALFSSLDTTC